MEAARDSDDLIYASEVCVLCREFSGAPPLYAAGLGSQISAQDDISATFPALGCFVEGYLLNSPREHVMSTASLHPALLATYLERLHVVRQVVENIYGPTCMFEHGMSPRCSSGGCVDHAHMHIVPATDGVTAALLAAANFSPVHSWESLTDLRDSAYLLISLPGESGYRWAVPPPALRSQYLRQVVAGALEVEDYDWAVSPCLDTMVSTNNRLVPALRSAYDQPAARYQTPNNT